MAEHHHGYVWMGGGAEMASDFKRSASHPDFGILTLPPQECADWLLKPASHIKATFSDAEEAADWFIRESNCHTDERVGTYPAVTDRAKLVQYILDGQDVVAGWYLTNDMFRSVNLIACSPHKIRQDRKCPNG